MPGHHVHALLLLQLLLLLSYTGGIRRHAVGLTTQCQSSIEVYSVCLTVCFTYNMQSRAYGVLLTHFLLTCLTHIIISQAQISRQYISIKLIVIFFASTKHCKYNEDVALCGVLLPMSFMSPCLVLICCTK